MPPRQLWLQQEDSMSEATVVVLTGVHEQLVLVVEGLKVYAGDGKGHERHDGMWS